MRVVVEVRVASLVGVDARVGHAGGGVVPPEEQPARRVRQRHAAAEHLEVHHVRRTLHKPALPFIYMYQLVNSHCLRRPNIIAWIS